MLQIHANCRNSVRRYCRRSDCAVVVVKGKIGPEARSCVGAGENPHGLGVLPDEDIKHDYDA